MSVSFQSYWGKAGAKDVCHRLPYHCLDVGACGLVLLRRLTGLRRRLEALSGLISQDLETFFRVYLPLHDLGKFATGFQNLRPDLLQRLQLPPLTTGNGKSGSSSRRRRRRWIRLSPAITAPSELAETGRASCRISRSWKA